MWDLTPSQLLEAWAYAVIRLGIEKDMRVGS